MQSITFGIILSSIFATLVAGEACVVGGPVTRVDSAEKCCYYSGGKVFRNYPNQAICVFSKDAISKFDGCFEYKEPDYVPTCIACDETVDCGLTR